jgi:hypothetical protein
MSDITSKIRALLLVLAACVAAPGSQAAEQFFPLQSYRVGPYAAGGTGFLGASSITSICSMHAMAESVA